MEPPSFPAGSLQTVRAAPGSDAELVLPLPSGTPPFQFEWSRAGASLDERFVASEGAGGVRLTVSTARTGDSGLYTLQASNAAGRDTRRLRLEVAAEETPSGDNPPAFLRRLQDLTVKVGTRTRFLVEIVSPTECKVTWYRNERRLMEAERVALVRDGNFWCADVATVSVDDAGRWTCTAENAGGRASCSAHLNVLVPKAYKRPEFVEELRALLTEQGTVSLECKVVGVPTPVLRWFKDSREIKAGDVFALTANAEDPTSLGTYTCEAVNCMGRAYSSSKVHVIGRGARDGSLRPNSGGVAPEPPPIFTKELEDQFVKICEHLTLSCHIVVPPWPRSVVWYNKEGKIEPSERYHIIEDGVGGYLLEVTSAEWGDQGEWKCVATSTGGRLGISTCRVTMDVPKNFRKPRFMENLQAVLTEEGLVSFECKVVGFPTPVLSWFKDGQELKPGDVYQLTGTNSLGSYCCIARNCMGQASSSAELTVEDIQNQLNEEEKLQLFSKNQAPKFLQGLKSVEAKIDEPFRFTIKVAIPPEPSVLWYRDDQPIDESPRCRLGKEERGTFFLDIQNLEFLDQAEWKCVAMNDFGHSVTSCFLKLTIPRHYKKPRFLENLQAVLSDEGAVNLECKVIGVPQPVLKWYKDGEELKPGDIHRIISGQDGTCCLGTYTCEAQNCMGIAASSASLLGFDDSIKTKSKKKTDEQSLQRNLSLSTIHEERTSQMYDTPMGDITLDDKGEISFSFDGKEVSVSLYETPDLTEEEALQIVEMYADQLSENITEHNVVELPPLRFVKETSTSGNLLMEAIIIDVSPDYFVSPEEDLRTEADIEDISIADENVLPQLSLDQDEEKTIAVSSEDKPNQSHNFNRKKSDSQKSGDDYFSLSRDQSISEEKRDDDTQLISESDLQSFASAHSSEKPYISIKTCPEDGLELIENIKTTEMLNSKQQKNESKNTSCGSENLGDELEIQINAQESIFQSKLKEKINNISLSLNIIINDVQNLEKDIILKSELMSSAATASKSLEIINSLITPLTEIYSINSAIIDSINETNDVSKILLKKMSQALKSLRQSLTIIEKCIEVGDDNRTLVKNTCVSLIEKCGMKLQDLVNDVKFATIDVCLKIEDELIFEIESVTNEVNAIISLTSDAIKTRNLLSEACELQPDELTSEAKHLQDTQKCIFNLKRPLVSLLSIVENAEKGKITDLVNVNNSIVILTDMSAPIQDLQSALEQIELMSVSETLTNFNKYNTDIIDKVMNPVLELRNLFESLSSEGENEEDNKALKQKLFSVKSNLNFIFSYLNTIEKNIGTFDILQSNNKLEALQQMAQILIALENNLPRLDGFPNIKNHMNLFHKRLTKALENIIESNETKKYLNLIEICDAVKRINNSILEMDSQGITCLASINNTLQIIKNCLEKNVFNIELNRSIISNIFKLSVCIQEVLNQADDLSLDFESEHIHCLPEYFCENQQGNMVIEYIDRTLATIATVIALQNSEEREKQVLPALENVLPILEELKRCVASSGLSGIENGEHVSEISDFSSRAAETLAKPLYELNQYIVVLNEFLLENPESVKECNIQISNFAKPLNELHRTLEILQHDVISQLGGDCPPHDFNFNIVNAVQNLQSAILIINENVGLERTDEMSTLDDISGIKTTADTVHSDQLAVPIIEQANVLQFLEPMIKEKQESCIAKALHVLNEHLLALQNPENRKILYSLFKINSIPAPKSLLQEMADLHTEIEDTLHSNTVESGDNIRKLADLAKPMLALKQSLSVVDSNNIPIFEHGFDVSSDSIHSVFQNISELNNHLEKFIQVIITASEISNNSMEISKSIKTIRHSCEFLNNSITTSQFKKVTTEKNLPLDLIMRAFMDASDYSKGINITKMKELTAQLHDEILTIYDDSFSINPRTEKEKQQEADILEVLLGIETAFVVLEQHNFFNICETLNIGSYYPLMTTAIETELYSQFEDVLKSTANVIRECKEYSDDFPLEVESFLNSSKNTLIILNYLIKKPLTFRSVTRLYQEFLSLSMSIKEFNLSLSKFSVSNEIRSCLTQYIENAKNLLEIVRLSLIKIFDTHNEMIVTEPLQGLYNNSVILNNYLENSGSADIKDLINTFLNVKEVIMNDFDSLDIHIANDLKFNRSANNTVLKNEVIDEWNSFETAVKEILVRNSLDSDHKHKVEEMLHCIEHFSDFKNADGFAKQMILLKCMSECSQILKGLVINSKKPQEQFNEKAFLTTSLTGMLVPLKDLHKQLIKIKENEISRNYSLLMPYTEICLQNVVEVNKGRIESGVYEVTSEDKAVISEICQVIQSIKNIENALNEKVLLHEKDSLNSINDIEKTICTIWSPEKIEEEKNILPGSPIRRILTDLKKFISSMGIIEKMSPIIPIENLKETASIAEEFYNALVSENILDTQIETQFINERSINKECINKLQKAIQISYVEILDHCDDIAITLGRDDLQVVTQVIEDMQIDLLAIMDQSLLKTTGDVLLNNNSNLVGSNESLEHVSHVSESVNSDNDLINKQQASRNIPDSEYLTEIKVNDDSLDETSVSVAVENSVISVQATAMTNKEIGKIINHIEEFTSQGSGEVISKLCFMAKVLNAEHIMDLATELKRNISEANTQLHKFDNVGGSNVNLILELQNAFSVMQTVIHERLQELLLDFKEENLQYVDKVLTNLSYDLKSLNASLSTKELTDQFQIYLTNTLGVRDETDSNNTNEGKLSEINSCMSTEVFENTADVAEQESTIEFNNQGDTFTSLLERIEKNNISSIESAIVIAAVENDTSDKNIALNQDKNYKETEDAYDTDSILTFLQHRIESVQQENSMQRLTSLLQEVSDKIDTSSAEKSAEDIENLENNLDEIQAVIIEIKRDYDGSANDVLNETLEDLECSVRSVQLQIHEDSPPEFLKEACATLHLLVTNMAAIQNVEAIQTTPYQAKLETILQTCSSDTEKTIKLLDAALNLSPNDEVELDNLFPNLSELKLILKSLKSNFNENIEIIIEKGIEIMQNLDVIEDRVFTLEKELDLNKKLNTTQRDHMLAIVHSIYGTISDMRSAMASVQKQYMFENYGKSSELVLIALKNVSFMVQNIGKEWKTFSKSLRKVLKHFEDIKFYINLDKTARIPSDATFTKIILTDLKTVASELILTNLSQLSPEIMSNTKRLIKCLENSLLQIENQSSLEVKDKIPIFKDVSLEVCALTKCIREYFESKQNQREPETKVKVDHKILENMNIECNMINVTSDTVNIITLDETKQVAHESVMNENDISNNAIEVSSKEKEINDDSSGNTYINNDHKSLNVSVLNIKNDNEITDIVTETYVPNFAFAVLPESIIIENVAETSLQLQELQPLPATSSQSVETSLLYEAKVTETVTEIFNEEAKENINLNNTDSAKDEQISHVSYKTQEVESEIGHYGNIEDGTAKYLEEYSNKSQELKDNKLESVQSEMEETLVIDELHVIKDNDSKGESMQSDKAEDNSVQINDQDSNVKATFAAGQNDQIPENASEVKLDDNDDDVLSYQKIGLHVSVTEDNYKKKDEESSVTSFTEDKVLSPDLIVSIQDETSTIKSEEPALTLLTEYEQDTITPTFKETDIAQEDNCIEFSEVTKISMVDENNHGDKIDYLRTANKEKQAIEKNVSIDDIVVEKSLGDEKKLNMELIDHNVKSEESEQKNGIEKNLFRSVKSDLEENTKFDDDTNERRKQDLKADIKDVSVEEKETFNDYQDNMLKNKDVEKIEELNDLPHVILLDTLRTGTNDHDDNRDNCMKLSEVQSDKINSRLLIDDTFQRQGSNEENKNRIIDVVNNEIVTDKNNTVKELNNCNEKPGNFNICMENKEENVLVENIQSENINKCVEISCEVSESKIEKPSDNTEDLLIGHNIEDKTMAQLEDDKHELIKNEKTPVTRESKLNSKKVDILDIENILGDVVKKDQGTNERQNLSIEDKIIVTEVIVNEAELTSNVNQLSDKTYKENVIETERSKEITGESKQNLSSDSNDKECTTNEEILDKIEVKQDRLSGTDQIHKMEEDADVELPVQENINSNITDSQNTGIENQNVEIQNTEVSELSDTVENEVMEMLGKKYLQNVIETERNIEITGEIKQNLSGDSNENQYTSLEEKLDKNELKQDMRSVTDQKYKLQNDLNVELPVQENINSNITDSQNTGIENQNVEIQNTEVSELSDTVENEVMEMLGKKYLQNVIETERNIEITGEIKQNLSGDSNENQYTSLEEKLDKNELKQDMRSVTDQKYKFQNDLNVELPVQENINNNSTDSQNTCIDSQYVEVQNTEISELNETVENEVTEILDKKYLQTVTEAERTKEMTEEIKENLSGESNDKECTTIEEKLEKTELKQDRLANTEQKYKMEEDVDVELPVQENINSNITDSQNTGIENQNVEIQNTEVSELSDTVENEVMEMLGKKYLQNVIETERNIEITGEIKQNLSGDSNENQHTSLEEKLDKNELKQDMRSVTDQKYKLQNDLNVELPVQENINNNSTDSQNTCIDSQNVEVQNTEISELNETVENEVTEILDKKYLQTVTEAERTKEMTEEIKENLSGESNDKECTTIEEKLEKTELKQDRLANTEQKYKMEKNVDVELIVQENTNSNTTHLQNTGIDSQKVEIQNTKISELNETVEKKVISKKPRTKVKKKGQDDSVVSQESDMKNENNRFLKYDERNNLKEEKEPGFKENENELGVSKIKCINSSNNKEKWKDDLSDLNKSRAEQILMVNTPTENIDVVTVEGIFVTEKESLIVTTVFDKVTEEHSVKICETSSEMNQINENYKLSEVKTIKEITSPMKKLNESELPKEYCTSDRKEVNDVNCIEVTKRLQNPNEIKELEEINKVQEVKEKNTSKQNVCSYQDEFTTRNFNETIKQTQNQIITESNSFIENANDAKLKDTALEDSTSNNLNLQVSHDSINFSQIRQVEFDTYKKKSYDKILDKEDISNMSFDNTTKCKRLFTNRCNIDYESEFLRPGYIEKKFNNEYPTLEADRNQSCTFYKAQTLVNNVQYRPSSTLYSDNTKNNDGIEVISKALQEDRKVLTEKRKNTSRDVKRKPVFSTHLTDRTAVEGSRVKLTCSVLTSTEPKVVWYKNGAPLDNKLKYRTKFLDGLLTMEVLNAVPSDSAEYSCTVETDSGSVSTSANLKVYPIFEASPIPPTFTRSIRDKYHLAEDELVLECRIRGQPLPTIKWLKDNTFIESSERHQAFYLADGVCRLSISKPTSEDSGKYTCKAENSMWSDEISHIVTFTGKERWTRPHLTSLERSRLNHQTFEAHRPHFTNVLTDYKVAKGGTIGLQVEIKGSPVRVEWLREGCSITEIYRNAQTFVDHGLYTLALSDVTEKESGIYTCRAWSNHGNVDMNAAITVVVPNEIDGKPAVIIGRPQKDIIISIGEDLNISFRVQGEPKPKVTFMKGIRDITNSQRVCKMTSDDYVKFTLKRSVISDAGTYCILARNSYGCDRVFVTVAVRQRASSENLISDWTYPMDDSMIVASERRFKTVPNRIPGEPSVVDGGNNWVSLAWPKPDPGSGVPVQAYKIESWLLGKEGGARWTELGITPLNSFDVFNLKQGEEYHFRITPKNRHGWGESVQTTSPVGVGLAGDRPEFVDILPGQLKVLVGATATLKCSFKGKPIPEIVWMKNGHEIDEDDKHFNTTLGEYESSLTIDGVQIEDEARYSCEATNIHGRASTYARVAVVTDRLIWEADAKLKRYCSTYRERSADDGECPPQFTMRLRDRRVQATYPVRLTCQVIGRPPPVITWFKDGEEVVFDSRHTKSQEELFHTLEIAPTHLEDGGTYEAMARNSSGAISCHCNLVVDKGIRAYIAPEFCCGMQPLYKIGVGEELRISAVVEAYPSVGVTWYRDGTRLRPSRRAVMTLDRDGQIELAVASVTHRDAGIYTCTASNEVGKASTSGKVEVMGDNAERSSPVLPMLICPDVPYSKEPTFIRKPRSSEAREGDTVIIECEVIGDPKPDVYWLRDFLRPDYYRDASHFRRVGAGPEYRFEIPHAKLDYTGAYSVVARNRHGEAKAVISLQILAKDPTSSEETHNVRYGRVEVIPRFERELTDLLSHDGDAVEFECRVSGNPEPDVKWYHYSELIRDCSDFETTYELGTARLKIRQVTADDEGTYTCEGRNSLGKAKTSACLIVYPPGEPNTLSQRLRRPPALLSSTSTPRSTPARSMSRTRTPGPDMRSLGSPAREIAPKFYTYPFNKVAEEGDTVVFQCAVKGLPAPWATWDKDGMVIMPSSRIAIKEKDEMLRILEIEEVRSEDVGLYRVTLENDYGRAEASARLEVISHSGKFYSGGRSYSASPRRGPHRRSLHSAPRHD